MNEIITFSSKDLPFFFDSQLKQFGLIPYLWDSTRGNGFGENFSALLWIREYLSLSVFTLHNLFSLNWFGVVFFMFFGAFILFSILSTYFLVTTVFRKNLIFFFLFYLVYYLNTYTIMVFEGGQLGILLAYTVAPLVTASFIRAFYVRKRLLSSLLLAGLALSLETLFDVRMVYVTLVAVGLLWIVKVMGSLFTKNFSTRSLFIDIASIVTPILITILIHAFWILPTVLFGGAQSSIEAYIPTSQALHFFSFAKLENSLALLQPNWPENIFGKVSFMEPEFIVIPITAFISLLFIEKFREYKKFILFFAAISLVGAFLAKGINLPFGNVYENLFNFFPGFSLFRDPTKWYLLTALGYSVLIPFSVLGLSDLISKKFKLQKKLLVFTFIIFWFATIYPILNYRVGTFVLHRVPKEYVELKNFLDKDETFSRTLWFPSYQRYGYTTPLHPAVSAIDFYKTPDLKKLNNKIEDPKNEKLLINSSIEYVVIPRDTDDEIFLTDRKYDDKKYQETLRVLNGVIYLELVEQFKKLIVFEVKGVLPRFYILEKNGSIKKADFSMQNPTSYRIYTENSSPGDKLIFVEAFDKNWRVSNGFKENPSEKYMNFNSFILPNDSSTLIVRFRPQEYVNFGAVVSALSLLVCLGLLIYSNKKS